MFIYTFCCLSNKLPSYERLDFERPVSLTCFLELYLTNSFVTLCLEQPLFKYVCLVTAARSKRLPNLTLSFITSDQSLRIYLSNLLKVLEACLERTVDHPLETDI